jgi:tetratricopeptide (TPR) repeat protein
MPTRFHDQVMLGTVVIFSVSVLAAICAFMGLLGSLAETSVLEALNYLKSLEKRHDAFETLGKIVGVGITLLGGAYGIYQKFYFAEARMHVRLKEFQEKEESRLNDSNKHVSKFVLKPSPNRDFESPIFTDKALGRVVKEMNWVKKRKIDESLEEQLAQLEEQLDLSAKQKRGYERRKAQAYLLKGAVAAARGAAKNDTAGRNDDNLEALECFQKAFKLSGKKDPEALEYIGHQQVRLGNQNAALETFQQLEKMPPTEGQDAALRQARALKFQAEVYEWKRPQPYWAKANLALMKAVNILPDGAPHLERAEINEMHGRVREKQRAFIKATRSYNDAEIWYLKVIDSENSDAEEVQAAEAGLKRVREALHEIEHGPIQNDEGTPQAAAPDGTLNRL